MAFRRRDGVVRARLDGGFHHRVLGAHLGVEFDRADMIEHERHGAGFGQRAARLGEIGAHLARRAVAVVGQRLDDERDAAGHAALVAHLVVILAFAARRLLDGAVDIVLGHVLGARGLHGETQARVHRGVGHTHLGGDGDFTRELAEDLGADSVLLPLLVHDVLELTMSRHFRPACLNALKRVAPYTPARRFRKARPA